MPTGIPSGLRNRSKFRLFVWALITCAWATTAAGSEAYRIEVLVFRHESGAATVGQIEAITDFPGAFRLGADRTMIIPEDPAPLGVMSDRMRGIWRRLENSGEYTPLLFRVWEQSRIDYQPPVRLHDDEVLLQRDVWPAEGTFTDFGADDPQLLAPHRQRYYRLDGTVQLRRTRFLHLDLDLQYRLEIQREADPARGVSDSPVDGHEGADSPPPATGDVPLASMHRLKESRQVGTGDLLYFDSPYLGVLARVTETAGE